MLRRAPAARSAPGCLLFKEDAGDCCSYFYPARGTLTCLCAMGEKGGALAPARPPPYRSGVNTVSLGVCPSFSGRRPKCSGAYVAEQPGIA